MNFNRYNIGDVSTQGNNSSIVILQGVTFNVDKKEDKEAFLKAFKIFIDQDAYLKETFPKIFGQLDSIKSDVCNVKDGVSDIKKMLEAMCGYSHVITHDNLKKRLEEALQAKERAEKALEELKNQFKDEIEVHKLIEQASEIFTRGNIVAFDNVMEEAIQLKERLNKVSIGKMYYAKSQAWISSFDYRRIYENLKKASEHDSENIQYLLALSYYTVKLAKYGEAMVLADNILNLLEGTDDPLNLALIYNNKGTILHGQQKYDEALKSHFKALRLRHRSINKRHFNVDMDDDIRDIILHISISYNNIGLIYSDKDECNKAMKCHEKALELRKLLFGEEDNDYVATSYNNIGIALFKENKYEDALDTYNKALEMRKKVLGEEHPEVGTTYNNIGVAQSVQGEHIKAIESYNLALQIRLNNFPEEHPHILQLYKNLGTIYEKIKDYHNAIKNYEVALNIYLKFYQSSFIDIIDLYGVLALLYGNIKNLIMVKKYLKKAYDIALMNLGAKHEVTLFLKKQLDIRVFKNQLDILARKRKINVLSKKIRKK